MANDIEQARFIFENLKGKHLHFVGIKGTGMAALVEILYRRGAFITGSDTADIFYTDEILKQCNISPLLFDKNNITSNIDLVIYSGAYDITQHIELVQAVALKLPCILYTQALGLLSKTVYSCGICGVHGKTTTTGMSGTILKHLPLNVEVLSGSVISSFNNKCTYCSKKIQGAPSYFVAETCEYKKHFMDFAPKKIVLTSVESDHQDFYPTYSNIRDAFIDYCLLLPENADLIYCKDNAGALEVANAVHSKKQSLNLIEYGKNATGDYKLLQCKTQDSCQLFSIAKFGSDTVFKLRVPGEHLVLNAVASIALCCRLLHTQKIEISPDIIRFIQQGVYDFCGAKRRGEITGHATNSYKDNILFIDDYAHHPTAINATLSGYKDFYNGRKIIVDFMSHTYTRTQALLDDFARAFTCAHKVIINEIYGSARENKGSVTGEILAKKIAQYHENVHFEPDFNKAAILIEKEVQSPLNKSTFPKGYLVITMGAGDNWKVGMKVQDLLKNHKS